MQWAFRILAAANALLLATALFYQAPGEDPAGAGLRLGFAMVYAVLFAGVLLLHRFVKAHWARVTVLVLLTLPLLTILYGISRSL